MKSEQWLPRLPDAWAIVPARALLRQRHERSETGDEELLSVSEYTGIQPKADVVDEGQFLSRAESLVGYRRCSPGDLVMNIMLAWKRGLGVSEHAGIVSPSYAVFAFLARQHPRYYHYLFRTDLYASIFGKHSTGIISSRWRLYPETFMALPVINPPLEDQIGIAAFLDKEMSESDAIVKKYEQLIKLLDEKRAVLVTTAVSKGLDESAPTKDSGLRHIGFVPKHWDVGPVKRFFRVLDYRRIPISSEERGLRKGPYPYYGASGIIDHVESFIFDEDLILVSEDGANLLNRASRISFLATGKYWVNNHAHILKPKSYDALPFWAERIEAEDITPLVTGSAQPKFTIEALKNLVITVPETSDERTEIAQYVERVTETFSQLRNAARHAISIILERNSALITAAVTGQIDFKSYRRESMHQGAVV